MSGLVGKISIFLTACVLVAIVFTMMIAKTVPVRAYFNFHRTLSGALVAGMVDMERLVNVRADQWCINRHDSRSDTYVRICIKNIKPNSFLYTIKGKNFSDKFLLFFSETKDGKISRVQTFPTDLFVQSKAELDAES